MSGYDKTGQLSLFIVLAIVIIAGFIALSIPQPGTQLPSQINTASIQQYLDACFEHAVQSSLLTIEAQGVDTALKDSVPFEGDNIAVLVNQNKVSFPTKEDIESQMEKQIRMLYEDCAPRAGFKEQITQDLESSNALVTIYDDKLVATISVPTQIRQGSLTNTNPIAHTATVPTHLIAMLDKARYIAGEIARNPDQFPLHTLTSGLYPVYVYPIQGKGMVVRLFDEDPFMSIDEDPQTYSFATVW